MKEIKHITILAYDYPPYVSVGALRPGYFSEFFSSQGIEVAVFTRQWNNKNIDELDFVKAGVSNEVLIEKKENLTIYKTPYFPNLANKLLLKFGPEKYRLQRKIITAYYEIRQWFKLLGPKVGIYHAARNFLKTNKSDVIIASGNPYILFRYADLLSKEFGVPWIADYRDPWSNNLSGNTLSIFRLFERWMEKKYVSGALFITTPNVSFLSKINSVIPKKKIFHISNGFDDSLLPKLAGIKQNDKTFTMAFVGMIYKWHHFKPIFEGLDKFIERNPDIKFAFEFIGCSEIFTEIKNSNYQHACFAYFKHYPKMSNLECLQHISKANLLLLLNNFDNVGTKIFDYIAVERKIIFCFDKEISAEKKLKNFNQYGKQIYRSLSKITSPQVDILQKLNNATIVKDKIELPNVLQMHYEEWRKNGNVTCHIHNKLQFSRSASASKLLSLIHSEL
jgi:hypothetical protein